jgi:hypothetical protein
LAMLAAMCRAFVAREDVRPRCPVELVGRFGDHPAMGFNRPRWRTSASRSPRRQRPARRATDAQVLEDAERLIGAWNERQAKRMPMLVLANDWSGDHRTILVPVGALPCLPHNAGPRPPHARSPPRRGGDKPHSRTVVPLVSAERAVRRARETVKDKHRRRDARRARAPSSRRLDHQPPA